MCVFGGAHWDLTVGFRLLRYSFGYTVESLALLYLISLNILMCMYKEMMHRSVRDLSCEPTIYVS